MPNSVDQELFVLGPARNLDRFCRLAVTGTFDRAAWFTKDEAAFRFDRVCPLVRKEKRLREHRSALLQRFVSSRTEALLEMQTAYVTTGSDVRRLTRCRKAAAVFRIAARGTWKKVRALSHGDVRRG